MTTQPYNQPATAGWYPDPSGAPRQRYFNGMQWTDACTPLADDGGCPEFRGTSVAAR